MKKIILCPPTYFDVSYEINPWMDIANSVDRKKVLGEYEILKKTYENLGVTVIEISPDKTLPDMVYMTDSGVTYNQIFISANFKYQQRKLESKLVTEFLKKIGYRVTNLPEQNYFEGGDLLEMGEKYFMGYGPRTSFESHKDLSNLLSAQVTPLELINPYYFHLDTAFMPLGPKIVLIYPRAFTKDGLKTIYGNAEHIIEATTEESFMFACNGVVVNKTVVIGDCMSDRLLGELTSSGLTVSQVPMSEYRKGGGSVRCLTLKLF